MSAPETDGRKPESQMDDCDVICPYCGESYQAEGEDASECGREETCFHCERVYIVWQEFTVENCTRPKETLKTQRGDS